MVEHGARGDVSPPVCHSTVSSVGARARVDPTWDGGDGVRDGEWRLARQRPRQLGLQQQP